MNDLELFDSLASTREAMLSEIRRVVVGQEHVIDPAARRTSKVSHKSLDCKRQATGMEKGFGSIVCAA